MCKRPIYLAFLISVAVLGLTSVGVAADANLLGRWKFDEGAGSTVSDASGHGNDGTLMNNPQWVVGKLGGALSFNGSSTYVEIPYSSIFDKPSQVTLAAWVNPLSFVDWAGIISFGVENSPYSLQIWSNGIIRLSVNWGTVTGGVGSGSWNSAAGAMSLAQWQHIAATCDGSTIKFYCNGLLVSQESVTLTIGSLSEPVFIGADFPGGDEYFTGAIDDPRIYSKALSQADVQAIMFGGGDGLATAPTPKPGATDIPQDESLSWTSGEFAATHDMYFGTVFEDVNTASRTDPKGVLASQGQTATTFDPAGLLDFGQTYYWRVDEVNAAPDSFIYKGDVWSFTAETYGYYVKPIKATASSFSNALAQPDKTIDGSGLDALDQHSLSSTQMWLSKKSQTPVWIQYEFDAVYSLHEMWVWNQNQMTELDNGNGAKDVTIEVSTDGTTWTALEGVPEFAQATGEPNYVHNTTVEFGGVRAKFVKLNILSNWGDAKNSGLSEVRFYYVPVKAFGPTPTSGGTGVAVDSVLNWRAGRTAASHEVYLGTDPNALSKVGTVTEHHYSLSSAGAEYDRTYYWKVNEVNEAQTPKTWEGDAWSFSTPGYFVVDDFESYDDNCKRVYYTWADGYGATPAPECGAVTIAGNGSGAGVGNQSAPYAEQTIVHGGKQSLPLFYDNPGATSYSEATRTFTVPQDWVQGGVKTLVLYFYGASDNAAGQPYVKINNNKVVYNGKSDVLTIPMWRQWNIDLASMGGNLRSVTTLAVGVSGTGKGLVLIDDIRLYRDAPAVAVPTDPGTTGLSAYYAFEGDVKDGSGKGNNGTANGDPTYTDSLSGLGKALVFDGINDHVDLPIGNLISTLTSATFASWVNVDPLIVVAWPRIFDFGTGNTDYIMLSPHQGTDGPLTCDIRVPTPTQTAGVQTRFAASRILPTGWHHVAVVIDGAAMTFKVYQDGTVVASGTTTVLPKDLGVTTQNWLGRSQFTADAYLVGELDEFRIYNRALSEGEVRYLAGDR